MYDVTYVLQSIFYLKTGRNCPRDVNVYFYFTQCLMDKVQIVNYSKSDTPSSESYTSVVFHSHRPENPKSFREPTNAEDGLLTRWATVTVLVYDLLTRWTTVTVL
jgi:hypothetical protein